MNKTLLFFGYSRTLKAKAEKKDGSDSAFAAGTKPTWSLKDDANTGTTLTPSEDGLSAVLSSPNGSSVVGDVTVTVEGEGDETPGVDPISGSQTFSVLAEEATKVEIIVGDQVANG